MSTQSGVLRLFSETVYIALSNTGIGTVEVKNIHKLTVEGYFMSSWNWDMQVDMI